jgi:hypothetical protein
VTRSWKRIAVVSLVASTTALGLAACGGGSDSSTTTTTTSTTAAGTKQLASSFDAAVSTLNKANDIFNSRITGDLKSGNLQAVQADAGTLRDAYFEFDGALRKLSFPASMQEDLNAVLEAIRTVIADMDAIGGATTAQEGSDLLHRFIQDQTTTYKQATDKLIQDLRQG